MRRVASLTACSGLALLLSGCALNFFDFERREAWRGEAERACLRAGHLAASTLIELVREISGKGVCGIERPLKVAGLAGGYVRIGPAATLGCPVTAAAERWIADVVQPVAMMRFGVPVVEIRQMSSYACRSKNNVRGASLSEHAFGNALDVGAFKLADGREIKVKTGWRGAPDERAFLREVHGRACGYFSTVLGPGSDRYHHDHFHLDLARNGKNGTSRTCKPAPVIPPPAADPFGGPVAGWPAMEGPLGFVPGTDPEVTGAVAPEGGWQQE